MIKNVITLFSTLLISLFSLGAQDKSLDQIMSDIIDFSASVSSVNCDFVQTKESYLLAETAMSSGHMVYRRPGYLEWDYVKPNPFSFIADGENISISQGGRTEVITGNQGKIIREMTSMIVGNIEGSILTNDKLFQANYDILDGSFVVTLIPQKRDIKKMWLKLVLYYDLNNFNARRFEMYESTGDLTVITFTNIKYGFSE